MRCDENIAPYEIQFIKPIKYRADAHMGPIILSPQSQKCNSPLAKEGGHAIGVDGGIDARATKQSPGLFLPNANAFGASCLLHCVQFTHRTLQIFNLSASLVKGDSP